MPPAKVVAVVITVTAEAAWRVAMESAMHGRKGAPPHSLVPI